MSSARRPSPSLLSHGHNSPTTTIYKKRASSANNEALLSSGPLRLGDKVGGPCSYRDDVEPSGVSETSMPLPQHPLCDLPAPLADPQYGKGRARPPTDTFC